MCSGFRPDQPGWETHHHHIIRSDPTKCVVLVTSRQLWQYLVSFIQDADCRHHLVGNAADPSHFVVLDLHLVLVAVTTRLFLDAAELCLPLN